MHSGAGLEVMPDEAQFRVNVFMGFIVVRQCHLRGVSILLTAAAMSGETMGSLPQE